MHRTHRHNESFERQDGLLPRGDPHQRHNADGYFEVSPGPSPGPETPHQRDEASHTDSRMSLQVPLLRNNLPQEQLNVSHADEYTDSPGKRYDLRRNTPSA